MALQKSKNLDNGLTVSYWRIHNIRAINGGQSEVYLAGYKDKDIRDANVEAYADGKSLILNIPKDAFINGNVYEVAYGLITESKKKVEVVDGEETEVETNWFADAENV